MWFALCSFNRAMEAVANSSMRIQKGVFFTAMWGYQKVYHTYTIYTYIYIYMYAVHITTSVTFVYMDLIFHHTYGCQNSGIFVNPERAFGFHPSPYTQSFIAFASILLSLRLLSKVLVLVIDVYSTCCTLYMLHYFLPISLVAEQNGKAQSPSRKTHQIPHTSDRHRLTRCVLDIFFILIVTATIIGTIIVGGGGGISLCLSYYIYNYLYYFLRHDVS